MKEKLCILIDYLLMERREFFNCNNFTYSDCQAIYRSLVNTRKPVSISKEYLKKENEYLKEVLSLRGIVSINDLYNPCQNIYIYEGDITTLQVDIMVSSGTSTGLGCFFPNHHCTDNAIHTYAGVCLRKECYDTLKGKTLKDGDILVCNGYNLPCQKVITVKGPEIFTKVHKEDEKTLIKCYEKCLDYALQNHYQSIAFPMISTGDSSFPMAKAQKIVYKLVKKFALKNNLKIVIVLYHKEDYENFCKLFKNK